jgi:hypothetical protein
MAKVEERPVDAGLTQLNARDEAAATEWWKQRFALVAGVPTDIARAGALLPSLRQLSRLPEDDRRRLTKARMLAFVAVPADQRQRILTARKLAVATDPELIASDQAVVDQLIPEVPGAADMQRQMGA